VSLTEPYKFKIAVKLLEAICACILLGILASGLWPFHAPLNEVAWSGQGYGLRFGKHGSIVSSGTFERDRSENGPSCSLEIWLEPNRVQASGTVLSFYRPPGHVVPFALRQSLGDLVLQRSVQPGYTTITRIYVPNVFTSSRPVFFTINSGVAGIEVYRDGTLVKKNSNFKFSDADLTGLLILGNKPSGADSWTGRLNWLAIYGRELSTKEVSQHFADSTKGQQLDLTRTNGVIAAYLFNEGKGDVARNQVSSLTDLLIPQHFFVLREQLLESPWDAYRSGRAYWKDVAVNVVGFIPLGFFFCTYFSVVGKIKRLAMVTISLGFFVSFTIEFLQAFLPTRNSDMTDVLTNTLGTAIGVILCLNISQQRRWPTFMRARLPHE
jgi:VanZ family protein